MPDIYIFSFKISVDPDQLASEKNKSEKEGKYQELIQSSITPDHGQHMEKLQKHMKI